MVFIGFGFKQNVSYCVLILLDHRLFLIYIYIYIYIHIIFIKKKKLNKTKFDIPSPLSTLMNGQTLI